MLIEKQRARAWVLEKESWIVCLIAILWWRIGEGESRGGWSNGLIFVMNGSPRATMIGVCALVLNYLFLISG